MKNWVIVGLMFAAWVGVSTCEYRLENEPVKPTRSKTHEKLDKLVPKPVSDAIIRQALAQGSEYPVTLAAIAKRESNGDHKAIGDKGESKGAFQVQAKHWGPVGDDLEAQVAQATRIFLELVQQHGYRKAVQKWNGEGKQARKYQQQVLAMVREAEK